jgi:hypothetical protein
LSPCQLTCCARCTLILPCLPLLSAGAIFFADLFVSLHVGFIATHGTRKLLVMNGRLVARSYLLSVSMSMTFPAQIMCPPMLASPCLPAHACPPMLASQSHACRAHLCFG